MAASFLTPVIAVLVREDGDLALDLEEGLSRRDDAYWAALAAGPFTWRGYWRWWAARRWVRPRDVRRG